MKLVVALLACVLLLESTDARFLKGNSEGVPFICSSKSPCGWEVYKPYFRTIEYFMKSPCECPSGTVCVRSSDDISISAYVHRCSPLEEENE